MEENNIMTWVITLIIIGVIMYFTIPYMYKDCKKVGHTTLYCVLDAIS